MELQSLIQISFMETLRFGDMGGLRIAGNCFSRMIKLLGPKEQKLVTKPALIELES